MRLFSATKRTILIAVAGILFILSLNFFQKEAKGFFYSFSEPIQRVFWRAGGNVSDFFESIFNAKNLKKENEILNSKVQELFLLRNSVYELEKENAILREAVELGLKKEFRLEFAEIISKDTNKDVVLMDKGSEDGIINGLPIITSQKILIGQVAEVYRHNSKILLISAKESQLQAKISGTDTAGLLKGLGSGRVLLDLIPVEDKIEVDGLVISGDFLIGSIKEIKKIDVSPFQQAEITPLFSIRDLDKVFIVLNF